MNIVWVTSHCCTGMGVLGWGLESQPLPTPPSVLACSAFWMPGRANHKDPATHPKLLLLEEQESMSWASLEEQNHGMNTYYNGIYWIILHSTIWVAQPWLLVCWEAVLSRGCVSQQSNITLKDRSALGEPTVFSLHWKANETEFRWQSTMVADEATE